jgi:hypothetical protein
MIECNRFDLSISFIDPEVPIVRYQILTDLPAGTRVIISAYRTYLDYEGNECVWSLFWDDFFFGKSEGDTNGVEGIIDINAGDKIARREFEDTLSDYSSGIEGELSDEIVVDATVGLRQRLKIFGKNNCNLVGQRVHDDGTMHLVKGGTSIFCPILDENSPFVKEQV